MKNLLKVLLVGTVLVSGYCWSEWLEATVVDNGSRTGSVFYRSGEKIVEGTRDYAYTILKGADGQYYYATGDAVAKGTTTMIDTTAPNIGLGSTTKEFATFVAENEVANQAALAAKNSAAAADAGTSVSGGLVESDFATRAFVDPSAGRFGSSSLGGATGNTDAAAGAVMPNTPPASGTNVPTTDLYTPPASGMDIPTTDLYTPPASGMDIPTVEAPGLTTPPASGMDIPTVEAPGNVTGGAGATNVSAGAGIDPAAKGYVGAELPRPPATSGGSGVPAGSVKLENLETEALGLEKGDYYMSPETGAVYDGTGRMVMDSNGNLVSQNVGAGATGGSNPASAGDPGPTMGDTYAESVVPNETIGGMPGVDDVAQNATEAAKNLNKYGVDVKSPDARGMVADFDDIGIDAADITKGMATAVENGVSATVAAAAQAAADAAAQSAAVGVLLADPTIAKAMAEVLKKGIPEGSTVGAEMVKYLGGKEAAEKVVKGALENGKDVITGTGTDAATKAFGDQAGQAGDAAQQMGEGAYSKAMEEFGGDAQKALNAAAAKAAPEATVPYKVVSFNYAEYALLIAQALKANQVEGATREVSVVGAEPMQDTQGAQGSGASTSSVAPVSNKEMVGISIGSAAGAMISLLKMNPIDISLLSTDIQKPETKVLKEAVQATSSKSQAGVDASETQASSTVTPLATKDQQEISHRRSLLLGEWAAAATQIGEGSNAISSDFYTRSAAFAAAANAASGSLGGINAITDTDRFVLFEQTRGAALSAVQLGLQGAVNLNTMEGVTTSDSSSSKGAVNASKSASQ